MKTVHIVRHGESQYNARKTEARALARAIMTINHLTPSQLENAAHSVVVDVDRDPSLHDCSLTSKGFSQAQVIALFF